MEAVIVQAKEALGENDCKKALKSLKLYKSQVDNGSCSDPELYKVFADAYLEDGQLDKAYPCSVKSCELDPQGTKTGTDQFFTSGQVVGGPDGIQLISQGIENVSNEGGDNLNGEQVNKIVGGSLSMIEIWMTDLCMEPEAESQCEELINKALEITERGSPDVLATLGSIRISQQKFNEACEAFSLAWESFEKKKDEISNNLDSESSGANELVELLQPLLSLAKMCIEVGLYEIALKVIGAVRDIDEDNIEGYYLEGFTTYMIAKVGTFQQQNPTVEMKPETIYEFNQHIQEIALNLEDEVVNGLIQDARISLSFAVKIGEASDPNDEVVSEIVAGANSVLQEIGGEVDAKISMKIKKGEPSEDIEANLDDEFESDNDI